MTLYRYMTIQEGLGDDIYRWTSAKSVRARWSKRASLPIAVAALLSPDAFGLKALVGLVLFTVVLGVFCSQDVLTVCHAACAGGLDWSGILCNSPCCCWRRSSCCCAKSCDVG